MYCVIKCIVRGHQARVKNADLRHPSCTVVMYKRKSTSPVLNVLIKGDTNVMHGTYDAKVTRYVIIMHFVMKIAWDSVRITLGIFSYSSCASVLFKY
jgi:hypothetical protein